MRAALRRWPLLAWLLLMVLAAGQLLRTDFKADLSAFLPADPDAQQRVLIEQLQSGVPARTLLLGVEGGDLTARAQASKALAAGLRQGGLFEQVQNGENAGFAEIGEFVLANRYLLSPAVDAERFTPEGLRRAITESLSLLGTPAGQALKPLLERDPTGETTRIAEALIPSSAPALGEGVWASRPREGSPPRALLAAIVRAPGSDLDAQAAAIRQVQALFDAHLQSQPSQPGAAATQITPLQLQISGAPVFGVQSRALIETEVRWLAIAGTVLLSAVLLLAFASLPALLVALLPVATGVVAGIVCVGWVFGHVHGLTLGFGVTLIGEAVDYAIYYLIQARQGGWQVWLRSGWPTVRLGVLTSLCGFSALVFSGFPGLAQLGVFSVAGLLGAVAFTRWVMPLLMPNGAGVKRGDAMRSLLGRFADGATQRLPAWRWPLWGLAFIAAVVVWQREPLWETELASLSPIPASALALDASLRADLSAGDARTLVVVQGADLQRTLQAAETTGQRLETLVAQGQIGGYDSVTRWLPSLQTQQQRQASLPDAASLRSALATATQDGPLRAERLEPFVQAVQQAREQSLVTLEGTRNSALAPLLDVLLLARADGSYVALMPLQPTPDGRLDSAEVRRLLNPGTGTAATPAAGSSQAETSAAALSDQATPLVLELGPEMQRLYAVYIAKAREQALWGAAAVVLLMAVVLRSTKRLLAVCQPLFLAVLMTMGMLAALQVPLGILHLVGLLLVVAVGSNYALFFDALRHPAGSDPMGIGTTVNPSAHRLDMLASLLLANLTTVLGFGLIAMSSIPALSAIGQVVAPGAFLALLLAAACVPSRRGHRE